MTSVPCVESVVQLVSCCSLIWIAWCQGHVLCDAVGTPSSFRHADHSFKSVRLSISSRGSYPPFVSFWSRRCLHLTSSAP